MGDIVVAFIAALAGWQHGRLGRRELKGIAIVAIGWTVVTTVANFPAFSLMGTTVVVLWRAAVVGVPYAAGVGLRRWRARR